MDKKTKGRQILPMKKIEDLDALHVSFSKRRSGLFKKASELSTLCGAELAVVVYSPAGRVFTFGEPGVDAVADRFLGSGSSSGPRVNLNTDPYAQLYRGAAVRGATVRGLNRRCMELSDQRDATQKKREELLERLRIISHGPRGALVREPEELQSLGLEDLKLLVKDLEDLKQKVDARANQVLRGAAGPVGLPLSAYPIQMVNPRGNEAMNTAPTWFMGEPVPSSE